MENKNTEKESQPGVSGKNSSGKGWFNAEEHHKQRDLIEKVDESEAGFAQSTGKNLVGRSDLENQGDAKTSKFSEKIIFEAMKRSPEIDVSHIRVHVQGSSVTLEGTVDDPKEARAMKKIVENIPGVSEVINHLAGTKGIEL